MKRRDLARRIPYALFCAASLCASRIPAQSNPEQEIEEIARRIDKQLEEVDRLLLESAGASGERVKPRELLERSLEHGAEAITGIEDLIEKLSEMKDGQGGGQSQQPPQQQPQQGQGQPQQGQQSGAPQPSGGRRNRNESSTPEFAQQPEGQQPEGQQPQSQEGQEPGRQKPRPQPGGRDPEGGGETRAEGRNRPGGKPSEDPTGPPSNATGNESWGELQPYLNKLRNRGATPKVPAKFRKYWEAYLRNKREEGKGK